MLNRLHDALRLRTSPVIFFSSAAVIIAFVLGTILFTEPLDRAVSGASEWLLTNLGWFYILGVTMFLAFLLFISVGRFARVQLGTALSPAPADRAVDGASEWLLTNLCCFYNLGVTTFLAFLPFIAVGRFGRVKLVPDDEPPAHSGGAWFAMLFAAGIGSILMFWGVAEPVSHFGDPPRGTELGIESGSLAAARDAMNFTYYHFTLHTWTIFTLPALRFAYYSHERNLAPRVSSIFQPLLGEGIHGPIGKTIDIIAIIGTIFGVAVSVGLGTLQINGGLNQLFGVPETNGWNLIIIGVVCGLALISVSAGLEKGIKLLSNFNIVMAVLLMFFVLFAGGATLFILKGTIERSEEHTSELQ